MARKKLTDEELKQVKMLQASIDMYEKSKSEPKVKENETVLKRIEFAEQEVIEEIKKIDKKMGEDFEKKYLGENKIATTENDEVFNILKNSQKNDAQTIFDRLDDETETNELEEKQTTELDDDLSLEDFSSDMQYDIISLPSNGECYKTKIKRVPVAYITAYDENLITSPNLYKDGLIIDFLLHNNVLNKNIDVNNLCSGDVDAIILFLRITSYGQEFPIIVKDPETKKEIETVVDLSQLKYKKFNLKGDENGYFDFTLPLSKDKIKFKFLSKRDERNLKKLATLEANNVKANMISQNISFLKDSLDSDNILDKNTKVEFENFLSKMTEWSKKLNEKNETPFNKTITNRLEMSIISVNGNSDRKFISSYVKKMRAKDSLELRRYILENEPGVDFEITVERPESLGGGSFKTFLEWNDSVFLNIA